MAIFVCPNCLDTQDAPDEYVGRTAKCMKCGRRGEVRKSPPPPIQEPSAPSKPEEIAPAKAISKQNAASSRKDIRILIGLVAGLLVAQLVELTREGSSTRQWEYTIESPSDTKFDTALNDLGAAGWELIFARRATSEYGSPSYEMILKRPKR